MKRILVIMVAAMMVVGFAGQAMADWSKGGLTLAIYGGDAEDTSVGNEIILDLSDFDYTTETTYTTDITLEDLGVDDWSDVYTAIFGATYVEESSLFGTNLVIDTVVLSSAADTTFTLSAGGQYANTENAEIAIYNAVKDEEDGMFVSAKADAVYLDSMGTSGTYGGLVTTYSGDYGLETVLSADEEVAMTLYSYDINDFVLTAVATIYLSANEAGNLVISTSAVPVPGAFILLGSALMGIVGIRRKKA